MERVTGGCLCGKVRFVATGQPYRVGICRCMDCRKHHGALFHASAIFPQTAVTITGETRDFNGRKFCPTCASTVFGCSEDEVELNLGSIMPHISLCRPMNCGPNGAKADCQRFQ